MNKLHVLLYTDDPEFGGVAHYNHAIALGLVKDYRVTIAQSYSDGPLVSQQCQQGIHHVWIGFDTTKDFGHTLTDSTTAESILRQTQPDLIIFSDCCPFSNFAAKQIALTANIPYICVVGFVAPYLAERFTDYLNALSEQYAKAKAVIAVSQENLNLLHEHFQLPQHQGQVIHYGRPAQYFAPCSLTVRDRLRQEVGIPPEGVVCFTAARLEPVKGYDYQLGAMLQLRQTPAWDKLYFVWAGDGSLKQKLIQTIHELHIADRVKILGQRWDIADWHDAVDIFVMPSQLEGMPLAIMEAMAKGVPVIATAVSGIPEELGDTGKLLPDPKNNSQATVDELSKTLAAWAEDAELRQAIGEAGKQRAIDMFKEELMVERTVDVVKRALLPERDYVSPNLRIVQPDAAFPNMIVGNTDVTAWPYLRRDIPHNWYVDQRFPNVGFLSRDEAHILYNTALQFKGKRALEIGCWMGWSACHLALAEVELDVIDPLLQRPEFYQSVSHSLQTAGVSDAVNLMDGLSPQKIEELATQHQRRWALIFIDGNHDAPAPLADAIVCEKYAEADAMIVFHDLASPEVTQGLDYLKEQGWNTIIYQTMQIMGIAWRGNVQPVQHQPDPKVAWHLPSHLQHYVISDRAKSASNNITKHSMDEVMIQLCNWIQRINISVPVPVKLNTSDRDLLAKLHKQSKDHYVKGEWEEAIHGFQNVVKLHPASAVAHHYLSHLYWQQNDVQQSLYHYAQAHRTGIAGESIHNDEFQEILNTVKPYTLLSEERLFSLYSLAKQICLDDIPGNFVECGTYKGGSAALLAAVVQRYSSRPRLIYAFDTFEGMPDPTEVDRHNGIPANNTGWGAGTLKAPIQENLDVVCQSLGVRHLVMPVPGLFADTLPRMKAEVVSIALLHADGDWYESTLDVFNTLFDCVVTDGFIQIDDYGFWEGCRKAVHDFERQQHQSFALQQIDFTGVWFRKTNYINPDCCHLQTFWHLAEALEKLSDVSTTEQFAHATLKLVPELTKAKAMLARLQQSKQLKNNNPISKQDPVKELLMQVKIHAEQYQTDAMNQTIAIKLRQDRKQLAEAWLSLTGDSLKQAYLGELGQVQQIILKSGIQYESLTDQEQDYIYSIASQTAFEFNETGNIAVLLVFMLYGRSDLIENVNLEHVPEWLLDAYLNFIMQRSPLFQQAGEAERYYHRIERWVDYLHKEISIHPNSSVWQQVTRHFAQNSNFIPLYFNQFNLKGIYTKRADILEQFLQLEGYDLLDHEFPEPEPNRKIRLGILAVSFLPSAETFASLPVYEYISRDVEVILYSLYETGHPLEQYCKSCANAFKVLPSNLAAQVDLIRSDNLDILYISTNVTAVTNDVCLLTLHRLARVQVTSGGSVTTTGMRHLDYYLSGDLTDIAENAEQHYREKLIKLQGTAQCFSYEFYSSQVTDFKVDRAALGISEEAVVFVSAANLFKLLPELLETWAQIIASVPNSVLLMFPYGPNWSRTYPKALFSRHVSQIFAKFDLSFDRFIICDPDPVPDRNELKEYLKLADIYLDSYPFAGTSSLVEPLEVGLPSVAWQGACFRSAMGAALLKALGMPHLIAHDQAMYIQLAADLGTNSNLREQTSKQIRQQMRNKPCFLDSRSYSLQMDALFKSLIQQYRVEKLRETLELRAINWISFPNWHHSEEQLFQGLLNLLRSAVTHPLHNQLTLLIYLNNCNEADADIGISTVLMHLFTEESLEISEEGPAIVLVNPLTNAQWQVLLPQISARIPLDIDDQEAIENTGVCCLPVYAIQ